jgi:hypothetical protein
MSASNEWTEWHLTPRGWERGTEKEDFRRIDREPPADRVQTVLYRERLSSSFSSLDVSLDVEWECANKAMIEALTQQFGPAPKHL